MNNYTVMMTNVVVDYYDVILAVNISSIVVACIILSAVVDKSINQ